MTKDGPPQAGKKVWVSGATGTIGREVVNRLLEGGQQVTAVARTRPSSSTVKQVLGRQALSFAEWATDHASGFQKKG